MQYTYQTTWTSDTVTGTTSGYTDDGEYRIWTTNDTSISYDGSEYEINETPKIWKPRKSNWINDEDDPKPIRRIPPIEIKYQWYESFNIKDLYIDKQEIKNV